MYICAMQYDKKQEQTEKYYYINAQGYKVFTEAYHLKRGFCCKNGCKHCPYGYDVKSGRFKK